MSFLARKFFRTFQCDLQSILHIVLMWRFFIFYLRQMSEKIVDLKKKLIRISLMGVSFICAKHFFYTHRFDFILTLDRSFLASFSIFHEKFSALPHRLKTRMQISSAKQSRILLPLFILHAALINIMIILSFHIKYYHSKFIFYSYSNNYYNIHMEKSYFNRIFEGQYCI